MIDVTPLYAAFKSAGMTVVASWSPSNGSATQSADVLFDMPDSQILDMTINTGYLISYPSTLFPGLEHGENIKVNGEDYFVREVTRIDDGAITQATLSKH